MDEKIGVTGREEGGRERERERERASLTTNAKSKHL